MQDARRLNGRLFYWALIFVAASFASMAARAQSGPTLTTISDTVYRADGTPAQGSLVISWPAFTTAAGQAVAAGVNPVTLGNAGALSAQLAPNVGATPGNTVYTVVYQLDEGGAFFQEWSALFVHEEESGGRVCFHYPRLSPTTAIERFMKLGLTPAEQSGSAKLWQRETGVEIAKPLNSLALQAAFQAMPHVDENDRQTVVCYRSYFPAAMAAVY